MRTLMLNQKSGMLYTDIKTYVTNLKIYEKMFTIFPTDLYINEFVESGFNVGAQDIAVASRANQTGEVTGNQLSQIGVKTVIIGHSERRFNQKEYSDVLAEKFNEAIKENLNIVYCVGESLVNYKLKNTSNFILSELNDVLSKVSIPKKVKLYVAYEPIWAIGTGFTPTNREIENVISLIKSYLKDNNLENTEVLYGGSVNEKNVDELLKIDNLDGFLVGGASNDYKKTIEICEKIMNSTN